MACSTSTWLISCVRCDGQVPGLFGGVLPFLAVGHGLDEGMFPLLVMVAKGPVAGGDGFVPLGAGVVIGLASGGGFGVRADGAQASVEGAELGQSEFFADMAGGPRS